MTSPMDTNSGDGLMAQILLKQGETLTKVAVVDTKIDNVLAGQTDHETRIRALERFRWTWFGVSLVITAAGSFVGWLVGHSGHL